MREESSLTGIAITHGTATLEETAYFLHSGSQDGKTSGGNGSNATSDVNWDGADANLWDAVRMAATPPAGGMGVLTVLNNEIHSARDVSKSNTFRVETFRPNELGFSRVFGLGRSSGVLPGPGAQAHHGHSL